MQQDDLAIEPAATLQDAQEALKQYRPCVVVFCGHTFMGSLAFEDASGRLGTDSESQFETMILSHLTSKEETAASSRKDS
eukprot:1115205-Prymnesium_polylepis.1